MSVISHPEKVLFPADGITKGELAAYYAEVAPVMVPHLRGRPLTMERYPNGIDAKGFFHKDVARGFPAWLERVAVPKKGGTVHHPLINDARALQWMANQNCITPHVWNRRVPDLQHPDVCLFDLDPLRDVERRRRDLRAQRLEHRVAAGDRLGVVVLLRARAATPARRRAGLALAPRRGVALGCRLALACGVPRAVLGLGGRSAALEGALVLASGALRGAFLALRGAGASWLSHQYSNVFRLRCLPA